MQTVIERKKVSVDYGILPRLTRLDAPEDYNEIKKPLSLTEFAEVIEKDIFSLRFERTAMKTSRHLTVKVV